MISIGAYERAHIEPHGIGGLVTIADPTAQAIYLMNLEDYLGAWAAYKYVRIINHLLAGMYASL